MHIKSKIKYVCRYIKCIFSFVRNEKYSSMYYYLNICGNAVKKRHQIYGLIFFTLIDL